MWGFALSSSSAFVTGWRRRVAKRSCRPSASGTIVGLLSAMYFYAYAGFMIPAGLLIDGLGVRRVVSAGAAVMGWARSPWARGNSERALRGRFSSVSAPPSLHRCLKIAASWFPPSHFGRCRHQRHHGHAGALSWGRRPRRRWRGGWRGASSSSAPFPCWAPSSALSSCAIHPRGHSRKARPCRGSPRSCTACSRCWATDTPGPLLAFSSSIRPWAISCSGACPSSATSTPSATRVAAYASAVTIGSPLRAPSRLPLGSRLQLRKLPTPVLACCSFSPGQSSCSRSHAAPLGLALLFFVMGLASGGFVLTCPWRSHPPRLRAPGGLGQHGRFVARGDQGRWAHLDSGGPAPCSRRARLPARAYRVAFTACASAWLSRRRSASCCARRAGEHLQSAHRSAAQPS